MIARVLPSHQGGKARVMRCRSRGEMDALVDEAGFENWISSLITGVFSVSQSPDAADCYHTDEDAPFAHLLF